MPVTINHEQRLYVIPCLNVRGVETGYSCLGFEVLDRLECVVLLWLQREAPQRVTEGTTAYDPDSLLVRWQTTASGTLERYEAYTAIMKAGAAFSDYSRKQCDAELSPQLAGLVGHRVQVVDAVGDAPRRFIVGKSTGWMPCHLELATRRSRGGGSASRHYAHVADLGKVR